MVERLSCSCNPDVGVWKGLSDICAWVWAWLALSLHMRMFYGNQYGKPVSSQQVGSQRGLPSSVFPGQLPPRTLHRLETVSSEHRHQQKFLNEVVFQLSEQKQCSYQYSQEVDWPFSHVPMLVVLTVILSAVFPALSLCAASNNGFPSIHVCKASFILPSVLGHLRILFHLFSSLDNFHPSLSTGKWLYILMFSFLIKTFVPFV